MCNSVSKDINLEYTSGIYPYTSTHAVHTFMSYNQNGCC